MYVVVRADAVGLHEPEDTGAFHLRLEDGASLDGVLRALGWGRADDDGQHAWIRVAALRHAGPSDRMWGSKLDGMLAYASSKGWMSEDGLEVRAHIG
jgi:hypothetical protein